MGAQLVIAYPEHRIFRLAAEVARAVKHRAYGLDACLHAVGAAVELPLDYVVVENLPCGNIGLFDDEFRIALGRSPAGGIVYAEAVEHVGHIDLILVGEDLASVKILVSRDRTVDHKVEYQAEEILLPVDDIFRIIKRRVLRLRQIELTVNLTHVCEVCVVRLASGEESLHPVGDGTGLVFGILLVSARPLAHTASVLDLSHAGNGKCRSGCEKEYFAIYFHNFSGNGL